ncbi:MAG: aspartate aminotransferase family protein [Dehalococcoidales bacterium]
MMTDWQELEHKYMMHTVERVPLTLVKGRGARVWDEAGRRYLDFVAGWAVNSLGHCHPAVVKAVQGQVETLIQVSNHFYNIPQVKLARILVENSCLDKVFFSNSGAEATEGAVKLTLRYGKRHLEGACEVITATGSFHGRTLAMVSASGQPKYQQPYTPLPSGFVNVAFNDIQAIREATTANTCAVMLEPVQGEGGVNLADKDYLKAVRDWCTEKGILLILDEIQTGMGRTGTLFAYEQYGIEPDIMTLAKGLGGGIAIGAMLANEKAAVFVPGEHGSTFGGNPIACAAADAVVSFILEHDIAGNASRMGQYLRDELNRLKGKYPFVTGVRGLGLLLAVEFDSPIGGKLKTACLDGGLLVNDVKPNALRFMPPLNITRDEIDEALGILDKALAAV